MDMSKEKLKIIFYGPQKMSKIKKEDIANISLFPGVHMPVDTVINAYIVILLCNKHICVYSSKVV